MNTNNKPIITSDDVAKAFADQAITLNDEILAIIEKKLKDYLSAELAFRAYREWRATKFPRPEKAPANPSA